MRIVIGVSAGIAAYKAVYVVRGLLERGHEVRVIPTSASLNFVGPATWQAITGHDVHTDVFDNVADVEHVSIGRWADLVAVVPATADLLARAAHGHADDLLTATLLTAHGPVLMAPAMHTEMWEHAATRANVVKLRDRGVTIIEPAVGRLTGSDSGPGRLPEPSDLIALIEAADPTQSRTLAGKRVVISIGGTREAIDRVRFIGNRSSGRQGFALAGQALKRGAEVVTVVGAIESHPPSGLEMIRVNSALEMRAAMLEQAEHADVVIMAAAVADFRAANTSDHKIKKSDSDEVVHIELVKNPDILAELAHRSRPLGQILVGFAAETGNEHTSALELAQQKARAKGADLIVFNDVAERAVFGASDNVVVLLDGHGQIVGRAQGSKKQVASSIWDHIELRLQAAKR